MSLISFNTPRLHLRPTQLEDASFLIRLMNSEGWLSNIGNRHIYTIEEAEQYIRDRMFPQLERLGFSNFTVIRQSDGERLGTCGLYDREGLEGIDIGYAFLPEYQGQGYAFESARTLRDVSSASFNIPKLNAITTEANLASRKLLEKLEFTFQRYIRIPNDPEELLLYTYEH